MAGKWYCTKDRAHHRRVGCNGQESVGAPARAAYSPAQEPAQVVEDASHYFYRSRISKVRMMSSRSQNSHFHFLVMLWLGLYCQSKNTQQAGEQSMHRTRSMRAMRSVLSSRSRGARKLVRRRLSPLHMQKRRIPWILPG